MYIKMHCGATYEKKIFFDTLTFSKLSNFTEKSFYLCIHNDNPVYMVQFVYILGQNQWGVFKRFNWCQRSIPYQNKTNVIFLTFT